MYYRTFQEQFYPNLKLVFSLVEFQLGIYRKKVEVFFLKKWKTNLHTRVKSLSKI